MQRAKPGREFYWIAALCCLCCAASAQTNPASEAGSTRLKDGRELKNPEIVRIQGSNLFQIKHAAGLGWFFRAEIVGPGPLAAKFAELDEAKAKQAADLARYKEELEKKAEREKKREEELRDERTRKAAAQDFKSVSADSGAASEYNPRAIQIWGTVGSVFDDVMLVALDAGKVVAVRPFPGKEYLTGQQIQILGVKIGTQDYLSVAGGNMRVELFIETPTAKRSGK